MRLLRATFDKLRAKTIPYLSICLCRNPTRPIDKGDARRIYENYASLFFNNFDIIIICP